MAIFKLGAIVTDVAGSVGGTTLRRGVSNYAMYNKTRGGSKNKLLQNKQLGAIGYIFRQWNLFDDATRTLWNEQALLFTFPDKFGVARNLTGRQLFTKMNIQLLPVGGSITDPTGMTNIVETGVLDRVTITAAFSSCLITISGISATTTALVQAQVCLGNPKKPNFSRSEVLTSITSDHGYTANITIPFYAKYPFYTADYSAIFIVTFMNEFGFKSTAQWVVAIED